MHLGSLWQALRLLSTGSKKGELSGGGGQLGDNDGQLVEVEDSRGPASWGVMAGSVPRINLLLGVEPPRWSYY